MGRIKVLAKRYWKIYVDPPKESKVFLDVSKLPVMTKRTARQRTAAEPKQVAVDSKRQRAFVACMKGQVVQVFKYSGGGLNRMREIGFDEQCVEVEVAHDLLFVTTTNFARGPRESSHLHILDIDSGKVISSTDTGGEWSKVVKLHPNGRLAFVSNWHSHDVSVIDIADPQNPQLLQVIPCGESPRGIAFTADGRMCLVSGFYSSRIHTLAESRGEWRVSRESPKFDPSGYSGNLRDIVVAANDRYAWVSNMGRNMVHRFDVRAEKIIDSVLVGRFPNTVRLFGGLLLVSCRKDDVVCFVDTEKLEVVGASAKTGAAPTGLAVVGDGFLLTNFGDNTLEYHRV